MTEHCPSEAAYWWFARCFLANKPYIVMEEELVREFTDRLTRTWRTDKRFQLMLKAHLTKAIDYREVVKHNTDWSLSDKPSLLEQMVFEHLLSQQHTDNIRTQLSGLCGMLLSPEDRAKVTDMLADYRQLTFPWVDRGVLTEEKKIENIQSYLEMLNGGPAKPE